MIEAAKFQAILFVDVTNSVKLYSEVGDSRAHRMIVDCLVEITTIIDGGGGTVVQSYGDGLMCRFPTADEAYQSSIAIRDSERRSCRPGCDPDRPFGINAHICLRHIVRQPHRAFVRDLWPKNASRGD